MHVFMKEGTYYYFEPETVSVGRIPYELGEWLSSLDEEEIRENLIPLLEKKTRPTKTSTDLKICSRLVLAVAQSCNLGCTYCYAQQGSYGATHQLMMNRETVITGVERILDLYPKGIRRIQFFGGEPLLNKSLIEFVCEWVTDSFPKRGLDIPTFTIVTNGTLIDDAVIQLFQRYKFVVTVSLDGNQEINDKFRVFKKSSDSVYQRVSNAIKRMNQNRNFHLAVEITVQSENINQFKENGRRMLIDLETIHGLGVDSVHMVPVISGADAPETISCDNTINDIDLYFDELTKYTLKSLTGTNPLPIVKVTELLDRLMHKRREDHFCMAGITDITISSDGRLFPCFVFINNPETEMTSIGSFDPEAFERSRQVYMKNTMEDNTKCSNCWARGFCSNCIGNAYLQHGSIEQPIEDACRMQQVILERLVSEVTDYSLAEQEAATTNE